MTTNGLRGRRHRDTRDHLVATGVRLFDVHGFGAVTMEQIADEAGVSRRTLYRHFSTKDRIVVDLSLQWVESWDDFVASTPGEVGAREVIEKGTQLIGARSDDQGELVCRAWRVIDATPELETGFLANRAWTDRIVALLIDPSRGITRDPRQAALFAGAYLGALDAGMRYWATHSDGGKVADVVESVLAFTSTTWPSEPVSK